MRPDEARNQDELVQALQEGGRAKYLCFWGHQPLASGEISKSCFSQWWEGAFTVDGDTYATAEHYMMAEKARLFGDEEVRTQILSSTNPGAAKKLGREVRNFEDARWVAARFEIVVRGNEAKFGQDPALKAFLLGTGDRVLVEASPRDRIWGIGLSADDSRAEDPAHWQGLNLLGFALMEVRQRLSGR
jgi:ribA/ribD-fused uncharacterized protein